VSYTIGGITKTTTFVLYVSDAPAPNAENLLKVQAARSALTSLVSLQQVSQARANDATSVLVWIQEELAVLALEEVNVGITLNVNSAVAGTAGNPAGINGSFAATFVLSAGSGDTLATDTVSCIGTILADAYVAPVGKIYVSVSVEKLSLDGRFIVEPALLELDEGTKADEALVTLLNRLNIAYRNSGQVGGDKFYLQSVALPGYAGNPAVVDSPHYPGYLSQFDEGSLSGWMITVNNSFIGTSAGV
jgi:hypothetical protein